VIFRAGGLALGLAAGVPYVEVNGTRTAGTQNIGGAWTHLAVTGDGSAVRLYVNGAQVAEAAGALPAVPGGGVLGEGFTGAMDEVRLSAAARNPAYLLAGFQSQGQGGKLLAFGEDEEPGGEPNPILVLVPQLHLIDQIVIAFLGIMLVMAAYVMWAKGQYIAQCGRANRAFLQRFRKLSSEQLLSPDLAFEAAEQRRYEKSPLFRLFRVGIEEYQSRREEYRGRPLSDETVEAMRASVDEQQVSENEKLDRWMVLLTIAIAGGPFIGLFGTVVGVMFVFAAIAASGDVNINAIAPGVAAALMATVAGLFVAIPALFGYNYLSSRISALSSEMSIFTERLLTRIAESQHRAAYMRQAAE
jgi:biopolymer transport protein ExbB